MSSYLTTDVSVFFQLPKRTRTVNITATGSGFAILKVSYRYNVNVTGAWPLFSLDPQVDKNSDVNHLQLSVCSGYASTIILNCVMKLKEYF